MYKNIQLNKAVTIKGITLDSCYIVIENISIKNLATLSALFSLKIYGSKTAFELDSKNNIRVNEIDEKTTVIFSEDFTQGELFLKASEELVALLVSNNADANWLTTDFVIEE